MANLVDPDLPQAVEQVDLAWGVRRDPFQDLPDRRHAIRISFATAVLDVLTASRPT